MGKLDHEHARPATRRLRVFAFDPSLAARHDTASVNEVVVHVRWELDHDEGVDWPLPGPVGEYLEVIDHDPASGLYYDPVDLSDPYLLAQDGLPPSEGDPRFHQQMVYAVAMKTIQHFEQALGRVALWSDRIERDERGRFVEAHFTRRLRIYPHALREANAYYDADKKALLFGYFPASAEGGAHREGELVFTCLSYDIIAHEVTHALLDGVHPRFAEATNPDVLALHEAFADLVAMLQRFTHPGVLRHQIAATAGDLSAKNLLGELAQQMGRAIGHRGALRSFLVAGEEERERRKQHGSADPHERGAKLVAAIFEAFVMIYRSRVGDLFRIAGVTPGVDRDALHPELIDRLAKEAAKSADHVLEMCIRALDYCPPVDVTFSDYLRAIVTGDFDVHPEDEHDYRVALVDAFRRWGIYPTGVCGMSERTLLWPTGLEAFLDAGGDPEELRDDTEPPPPPDAEPKRALPRMVQRAGRELFAQRRLPEAPDAPKAPEPARDYAKELWVGWDLDIDRRHAAKRAEDNAALFHEWLTRGPGAPYLEAFGLVRDAGAPPSVFRGRDGLPAIEVHSVRTAMRRGDRGTLSTALVVELTQRRRGYFDPMDQKRVDGGQSEPSDDGDFRFRRGCTILFEPESGEIRRVIRTCGTILDDAELDRIRRYLCRDEDEPKHAFDTPPRLHDGQAFVRLHQGGV